MARVQKMVLYLAALCASALVLALPAAAAQSHVVADCNAHGRLTGHYTPAELRKSLSTMSADVKEYTNCYDLIQRALLAQIGSSHVGGTPASQSSSGSFLPTPVIVVLIVLMLGAAGFALVAVRRRGSDGGPNP
jgi:hypothetical protein